MPHMLTEKDTAVYASGQAAWHRLGTVDPRPGVPLVEIMREHGFDYPVGSYTPYIKFEDGVEVAIPDVRFIGSIHDHLPLGEASPDYVPISNGQVAKFMENLMDPEFKAGALDRVTLPPALKDMLGQEDLLVETAGTLDQRRRFWLLIKLPGHVDIAGMASERTRFYILATTTHGKSYTAGGQFEGFTIKNTAQRVECNNMLHSALMGRGASATVRHIGDVEGQINEARKSLGMSFKFIGDYMNLAENLMDRRMNSDQEFTFLKALLPTPRPKDPTNPAKGHWQQVARIGRLRDTISEIIHTEPDLEPVRGTAYCAVQGVASFEANHRKYMKTDRGSGDERRFATVMDIGGSGGPSLATRAGKILTGQQVGMDPRLESEIRELLSTV